LCQQPQTAITVVPKHNSNSPHGNFFLQQQVNHNAQVQLQTTNPM